MVIEYIGNAIKAAADDEVVVCAILKDINGIALTKGCHFMVFDKDDNHIITTDGEYKDDYWTFVIPTKGLKGTYQYCICHEKDKLCFKQPFYLV